MRKLFSVLLVLTFCGICLGSITKNAAKQLIMQNIVGIDSMQVNVYMEPEPFTEMNYELEGSTIISNPYSSSWVFFIDDIPNANWNHDCRYVFVDCETGNYEVLNETEPKLYFKSVLEKVKIGINTDIIVTNAYQQRNVTRRNSNDHLYALLLSGVTERRHFYDLSAIYQTLTDVYGFKEENIYALSHNGQVSQDVQYGNPSLDLNHDGVNDIDDSADYQTIQNTISTIGANMSEDDVFFLFVTDHGGRDVAPPYECYINLFRENNSPNLHASQLAIMLDSIPNYAQMIIVMGQCFSGGFINSLEGDRRSIYTATDGNSVSYYTDDDSLISYGFDEFLFYWTASANGYYPQLIPHDNGYIVGFSNFAVGSHPALAYDFNPDTYGNEDSFVQLGEIFNYANLMDVYSNESLSGYVSNVSEDPMSSSSTAFPQDDLLRLYGYEGNAQYSPIISGNILTSGTGVNFENYMSTNLEIATGSNITLSDNTNLSFPSDINLSFGNSVTIKGETASVIQGVEPNEELVPGNYVEIYGNCNFGTGFSCIPVGDSFWDGIYLYNDSEVNLNEADFANCQLYKENGSLNIQHSEFSNSGIHCESAEVSITECDTVSYLDCYACDSVDVSESVFSGAEVGISLTDCVSYNIQDSHIFNCGSTGISLYETNCPAAGMISDCVIENNAAEGIRFYHSTGDVLDCKIQWNNKGIVAYHYSDVQVHRTLESDPWVTENSSYIHDNTWQEILFTNDCGLILDEGENRIVDNSISGDWDQYLIQCPDMHPNNVPYFRKNYWGYQNSSHATIPPADRFYPPLILPDINYNDTGYVLSPVWDPGIPTYINQDNDELAYNSAMDLAMNANVDQAIIIFKQIISQYPESRYAKISAKHIYALEADKYALKNYYLNEPHMHYNGEMDKLADYLIAYCNIKLENYQDAITFFESVITGSPSELDSLMAIIDLGYVYLLMQENPPKSNVMCLYPQLVPVSKAAFDATRDNTLANLFGNVTNGNTIPNYNANHDTSVEMPRLNNNFPNPFNPITTIKFSLPRDGNTSLNIYNAKGQLIKTLSNQHLLSGLHTAQWNGCDDNNKRVASGVYYYVLESSGHRESKKMLLLK